MGRTILISVLILTLLAAGAGGQTTAFNFQGRLNDGTRPANGRYDLQFKLFDAIAGGNQVGATVAKPNTMVVNGVFSTPLDFGDAFAAGGDRFLEVSVRPFNSPNAYVVLGERQQILSVPLASKAKNADAATFASLANNANFATNAGSAANATNAVNATNAMVATNAENATNAATAQNALSLGGVAAAGYARLDAPNTGSFQVSGNVAQSLGSRGLPKAMLRVGTFGNLQKCYNGVTGANTGSCGFTLTFPLGVPGVCRIDLGFSNVPNTEWFVLATAYDDGFGGSPVASYRRIGNSAIEIFTYFDGSDDTSAMEFTVIIF